MLQNSRRSNRIYFSVRELLTITLSIFGCARCVCKQAFTHSLARDFAPKKAEAGKCVLSELNAKLA